MKKISNKFFFLVSFAGITLKLEKVSNMPIFARLRAVSLFLQIFLFFFRLSESNARARERRSRETPLRLAPSVTRVAIYVSRDLLDGLQKKERLLVV